jgi:ATPase subunit of ABC transporter with duplicated ATPase domains
VGANGSGKTTFLRILAGDEEASAGQVLLAKGARVGVLRQDRFLDDAEIILDLAMRRGRGGLPGAGRAAPAGGRTPSRSGPDRRSRGPHRRHDGYTLEARASAVLEGWASRCRRTASRWARCRAGSS